MLRSSVAILAVGVLLGAVGDSRAVVTDFTVDHLPVLLGELAGFQSVQSQPNHPVISYKWEVQGVGKTGNLGNWVVLPEGGPGMGRVMQCVGRLNVRLTVKYSPMLMPPLPDTVITHYVDILPPDNDVVVQGLSTPTPLDQSAMARVTIKFEMRQGGHPHWYHDCWVRPGGHAKLARL